MVQNISEVDNITRKDISEAASKLFKIMGAHTVQWLSDESGVSRSVIYRILNKDKHCNPTLTTRNRILIRFNIDIFSK